MGRPRLPVYERPKTHRGSRTLCVATNLAPEEIEMLDFFAGSVGETRSEFIRRAVFARMGGQRG